MVNFSFRNTTRQQTREKAKKQPFETVEKQVRKVLQSADQGLILMVRG